MTRPLIHLPRSTFPKKCCTKYCRNIVQLSEKSPKCGKCRARQWRENHPLSYAFAKLRNRAKERGHDFKLTREQFEKFAHDTGYRIMSGKKAHCFSINRKDSTKGYTLDNIECLTLSENSRAAFADYPGRPGIKTDANGDPDWSVGEPAT
jgi:hypothetical protein